MTVAATTDWKPTPFTLRDALIAALLAAATTILYWPSFSYGFVNLDDAGYVCRNPRVLGGFTEHNLIWALTTTDESNWHPLTWLSLQLDAVLGGGEPAAFHRTNVLLHSANVALLFAILRRTTGATGRSFTVAALWAAHPLHVESVAWISERKDVLSAFFGLLAIAAYARYVAAPSSLRYWCVSILLALGLMAKPMIVTLPAALVLLDVWPFRRLRSVADFPKLLWEKLPLLLIVSLSCYLTFTAQSLGFVVQPLENVSVRERVVGAGSAYSIYLGKTVVPTDMAAFYPRPATPRPWWHLSGSVALLALLTTIALRIRRSMPAVPVGWFWFLGSLVPMIGLVQVGDQAYADRYTYWPHIGLFVALVWGGAAAAQTLRVPVVARFLFVVALLSVCVMLTRQQMAHWKDGVALWNHTTSVTDDNAYAWALLGRAYMSAGEWNEAIRCADEAERIDPENFHSNAIREMSLQMLKR